MNNNQPHPWLQRTALVLAGVLLGIGLTIVATRVYYKSQMYLRERTQPEEILNQAETKAHLLTENDLAFSVDAYQQVLDLLDKNQSLDKTAKRRLQARALSGLSRTFADRATLKYWLGLTAADFPQRAQGYALQAVNIASEMPETQIALAYAYKSAEPEKSAKLAAQDKVNELLSKGINNLEIQYLAWSSRVNEKANDFPNQLRAEDVSDVRMLADIGLHFARLTLQSASAEKQNYINRADQFLLRAAQLSPDNAIVLFVRGYLSVAKGNMAEGRDYYHQAISREPEFPRALNNLGYTYAIEEDFSNAQKQFQAAVETAGSGAPNQGLRTWLLNLASASLEVGDDDKACRTWKQASEIPGASEDVHTFIGLAICNYVRGRKEAASADFQQANQVNKSTIDLSWFEKQQVGPKELAIARELVQLVD